MTDDRVTDEDLALLEAIAGPWTQRTPEVQGQSDLVLRLVAEVRRLRLLVLRVVSSPAASWQTCVCCGVWRTSDRVEHKRGCVWPELEREVKP